MHASHPAAAPPSTPVPGLGPEWRVDFAAAILAPPTATPMERRAGLGQAYHTVLQVVSLGELPPGLATGGVAA